MPKWKKDAKEFTVSINHNDARGYQSSIPKPIIDLLGEPRKMKFVIDGKNVRILPITKEIQEAFRTSIGKGKKK